jgi:hypothetical protein
MLQEMFYHHRLFIQPWGFGKPFGPANLRYIAHLYKLRPQELCLCSRLAPPSSPNLSVGFSSSRPSIDRSFVLKVDEAPNLVRQIP